MIYTKRKCGAVFVTSAGRSGQTLEWRRPYSTPARYVVRWAEAHLQHKQKQAECLWPGPFQWENCPDFLQGLAKNTFAICLYARGHTMQSYIIFWIKEEKEPSAFPVYILYRRPTTVRRNPVKQKSETASPIRYNKRGGWWEKRQRRGLIRNFAICCIVLKKIIYLQHSGLK